MQNQPAVGSFSWVPETDTTEATTSASFNGRTGFVGGEREMEHMTKDEISTTDAIFSIAALIIGSVLIVLSILGSFNGNYQQATYLLVFGWFMMWQGRDFK